jgi:hypothetical protein
MLVDLRSGPGCRTPAVAGAGALSVSGGFGTVRLETGIRQPEAIGLYESQGYLPIPRYGEYAENPLSRCFEKAVGTVLVSSR